MENSLAPTLIATSGRHDVLILGNLIGDEHSGVIALRVFDAQTKVKGIIGVPELLDLLKRGLLQQDLAGVFENWRT